MRIHFFTAPFYFAFIWFRVHGSRGGFAATIPMTIHAALFSPSFLWKEVPRRGGGWPRETVLPHSGKPTPPRFARLPLTEEGARMIFKETLITSLSFAVRDSRPHICRAVPLSSSVFHTACALSAPAGPLPLEGKAAIRGYPLLKRRHTTLVNLSAPQVPSSRAQPRDLYCTVAIYTHVPSLKRHLGASFFVFPSLTIYRSARRIPPLRSG